VLAPGFHQSTGMNWQYAYTSHILPSIFTVMLLMAVAVYAWRRRNLPGASWFVIYCLLALPILAFHVIEYLAVDFETKIFWFNVEYLWWLPGTTAMTCFILEYAWPGRWATRRTLALLFVVPVLGLAFTLSNDFHHLLFRGYGFGGDVDPHYGPAGWAFMAYNWGLRVVSTIALVWLFVRSPQHRWPAVLILLAETVVGVLLVLDPLIPESWFFYVPWKTIPVVASAIALFGFRILDPIPLAHQTVIEQLQAGMLVLDLRGRVISLNPAAEGILNGSAQQVKGRLVKELLPAYPEKHLAESGETEIELGNGEGTGPRYYMVTNSLLNDFRGLKVGRLLLLRDVTEQKRAQQQVLEKLSRLHEASSHLIATLDLDQTMVEIARQSAWLLRCQKAGVIRLARENGQFELAADFGFSQDEQQALLADLPGWDFLTELVAQPKTIILQDAMDDHRLPDGARDRLGLSAILITPIWISKNPEEFIFVMEANATTQWREPEIEQLESLANRAAVALISANLHHEREVTAALEERQCIAANMHDGLAQTLSLLGMRVDRMQEIIEDDSDSEIVDALGDIRDVVNLASTEVRRSIARLLETPRPRSSLQYLLQAMLENIRTEGGPVLKFDSGSVRPLYIVSEQTDQVMPAVHEALLNAFYHAKAQTVYVRLESNQGNIHLTVEDDGVGFSLDCPDKYGNHFGLSVMRARAARIGGQIQIGTSPGKGTRITLTWTPEFSELQNSSQSPDMALQANGMGR
jgi:PAS domain S-box-containing protein